MKKYNSPTQFLKALQRRNTFLLFSFALAGCIILFASIQYLSDSMIWWLAGGAVLLAVGMAIIHWKFRSGYVTTKNYLHEAYPEFEYSLDLLQEGEFITNDLQRIQKEKIAKVFLETPIRFPSFRLLWNWVGGLVLLVIGIVLIGILTVNSAHKSESENAYTNDDISDSSESEAFFTFGPPSIMVWPPEYTNIKPFETTNPNLEVPEGSLIKWTVTATDTASKVLFKFGEDPSQELTGNHFTKTFTSSEIYQLEFIRNDKTEWKSEFYAVKIISDKEPEIKISGIPEYQKLNWGEKTKIDFQIEASDDFGLSDMFLLATVAKGAGESVKFRDKKVPLKNFSSGRKRFSGNYSIALDSMEMEPGSELYFYIGAKDNCPYRLQMTKSLTYFIIIKDTTQYTYFDDGGMQVDLMPEFFRSQRQIIIDSEKLLRDRKKLTKHEFDSKSNELGFDQKMLRLKYGQFLGEEAESGIAIENEPETDADHQHEAEDQQKESAIADWSQEVLEKFGHNHDHEAEANQRLETNGTQPENPSRPEWVEALSHNHDNAEEKTYYDISIKSKLKAALNEMWDAELHLRLYDPASSLPYQYNALEYLEEIKNHARIYVHRIGFEPPSIKESEKRLTGKLDEIHSNRKKIEIEIKNEYRYIEEAIAIINRKTELDRAMSVSEENTLENAAASLAKLALEDTSLLPVLQSLYGFVQSPEETPLQQLSLLVSQLLAVLPDGHEPIVQGKPKLHPLKRIALKSLQDETE